MKIVISILIIVLSINHVKGQYKKDYESIIYKDVYNVIHLTLSKKKLSKVFITSPDGVILEKDNQVYLKPSIKGKVIIYIQNRKTMKNIDSILYKSVLLPRLKTGINTDFGLYSHPGNLHYSTYIMCISGIGYPIWINSKAKSCRVFIFKRDTVYNFNLEKNALKNDLKKVLSKIEEGDFVLVDEVIAQYIDNIGEIYTSYASPFLTVASRDDNNKIALSSNGIDNYDTSYLFHFECFAGKCYIERKHEVSSDTISFYKYTNDKKEILYQCIFNDNILTSQFSKIKEFSRKDKLLMDTSEIKDFIDWDLNNNWDNSEFGRNKQLNISRNDITEIYIDTFHLKFYPDSLRYFFNNEQMGYYNEYMNNVTNHFSNEWTHQFIPNSIELVEDTLDDEKYTAPHTENHYSFPIITKDKKYIIVHKSNFCGSQCGGGEFYIYEKIGTKKWRLYTKMLGWDL